MALDQAEARPARRSTSKAPFAVAAIVTLIVVLGVGWVIGRSSQPSGTGSISTAFLGVVTKAPSEQGEGIICVEPNPGEPSGIADGQPWCGVAYPSRRLEVGGITRGMQVRLVTFATRSAAGEDVSGALVLPGNLPNPPGA